MSQPEKSFILNAIRISQEKRDPNYGIEIGKLDWSLVLQIAIQQQVLPILYYQLKDLYEVGVLPEIPPLIKVAYIKNAESNLRLASKLIWLKNIFSKNGIKCLIFKGPALAIQAYHDLSARQFVDLDILIHREDFQRVYEILTQQALLLHSF